MDIGACVSAVVRQSLKAIEYCCRRSMEMVVDEEKEEEDEGDVEEDGGKFSGEEGSCH